MTEAPLLPPFIDATMMSAFRSCHQRWWAEYALGLAPTQKSVDLHAGGCFSAALEEVYRSTFETGQPLDKALLSGYSRFLREWGDFEPEKKTAKSPENVWSGVEKYFSLYPPQADPVQPLIFDGRPGCEFSFAIPLEPAVHPNDNPNGVFPLHPVTGEPFLYVGRFDMLGRHEGTIAVRDEKTGSRLESNWTSKWDLRSQFLGYCWALSQSGIPCNKTIVRGIIFYLSKPPEVVEAIKIYPQFLIARWHEQLRRDLWRLVRAWNEGYFDYNLGESCTNYGGCPYKDRCTSATPDAWNSNYKVRRWNPLNRNSESSDGRWPSAGIATLGHPITSAHSSEIAASQSPSRG